MIPKQYDSILSQIYGDYMTMPPVEKRTLIIFIELTKGKPEKRPETRVQ